MKEATTVIRSIFVIGVTLFLMCTSTQSYFIDTETSTANTLTSGYIDLAVSDDLGATWENPWIRATNELTDGCAYPGAILYDEIWLKNVGTCPMTVWKHIFNVGNAEGALPEPEEDFYDASDGDGVAGSIDWRLSDWIRYDVDIMHQEWNDPDWFFTGTWVPEIAESEGWFLSDDGPYTPADDPDYSGEYKGGVECYWYYLGELQPGQSMKVRQSYHVDVLVDNWAQGDLVTMDIEFLAQQTGSPAPTPTLPTNSGP